MFSSDTYQAIDTGKAVVQPLEQPSWQQKNITVAILRLDRIHPIISGNKWFKLKYYLQQAQKLNKKGIVTFGGAWSNHLVAAAYACKLEGLEAVGIVRGEAPAAYAQTLLDAQEYGMQLQFISRENYTDQQPELWQQLYPHHLVVPQGGEGALGVQGAADILPLATDYLSYTHLACAVGTGTMMAGIINASKAHQQVIGISSLKLQNASDNSIITFIGRHTQKSNFYIHTGYHFGGYARKNQELINSMNTVFKQHHLPTDFVYTGKLLYGVNDMIAKGEIPKGSKLLLIHSGGLQGNRSLPAGTLIF
ncbi:MAG: pyridoxal-phosphate dependent enzyme [Chitinophagaceae bacterium]